MKKMTKALFVATCCRFKAHMLEKMFGNYPTPKSNAIVKQKRTKKVKVSVLIMSHTPNQPNRLIHDDLCESGGRKSHKANQIK